MVASPFMIVRRFMPSLSAISSTFSIHLFKRVCAPAQFLSWLHGHMAQR
jgi:hypothetical protein